MSKHLRVLTASERNAFACERKWAFAYLDGLTLSDSPAPLRQGSLIHRCLAAYYRSMQLAPEAPLTPAELRERIVGPWLDQRADWLEKRAEAEPELADWAEETLAKDKEIAALSWSMLQGYVQQWGARDAQDWEILGVEIQVARFIRHPDHGRPIEDVISMPDGSRRRRRWVYGGAIDLVVRDRVLGGEWIVEHKTTVEADLDAFVRKLHWDPQIRGYPWAMQEPIEGLAGLAEPIQPRGVIYNALRKKAPRAPKQLSKCGACGHPKSKHSEDGCAGAKKCECSLAAWQSVGTSKEAIDTTPEVFKQALLERGESPDDFRDLLDQLEHISFFGRHEYPLTGPELAEAGREIAEVALRMREATKRGYHPRQQAVCTGPAAYRCTFAEICLEDGEHARAPFRVKTIRHEELEGDLAEPTAGSERGAQDQDPQTGTPETTLDPFEDPPQDGAPGLFDPLAW